MRITFHSPSVAAAHVGFLRRSLRRVLATMGIGDVHWHIRIARDAEMKRLHAQTLALDTTTDVLTFDLRDEPPKRDREGVAVELDSIVCFDEARRRAAELQHSLRNELLLYCLHSLLHVQGYDDLTPAQARRMHAREDQILTAMDIGPVYAAEYATPKSRKSKGGTP